MKEGLCWLLHLERNDDDDDDDDGDDDDDDDDTRDKPRKLFLPLLYIVEERGPLMQGPVAHWMRRRCLSDPSGLKHKLFWKFESLVRLDSAYT